MPKPKKKPADKKKPRSNRRPLMALFPLGQKLTSLNPLAIGRWLRVKAIKIDRDGRLSLKR